MLLNKIIKFFLNINDILMLAKKKFIKSIHLYLMIVILFFNSFIQIFNYLVSKYLNFYI